ncbi:ras family-domain-containing protein [Hyaloscypha sp. PMI_1271]|nr:ras family-domain-containing protein [Hyaloscypha sp. PMI_1271]
MPANLARISELHDWPLHEINDHTPGQFESQVIENAILAQRCLAINRKLERNGNVLPSSEVNIYPPRQPLASNKRKPSDNRDKSPENSPELAKKHSYKGVREYKLVVIGGGGVDKSSFAIQLIQSHFVDEYDPTILDSYKRLCVIDEKEAILDVLDTAGQEEYSAMREQYMRTGEGFLLIYSITSRRSFEEILSFQQQILRVKDLDYFPIIIVANHCDREDERQVSRQEGEALACSFGCQFIEASAKARINVEDSFYSIVREIRRYETEMKEYEKRKEVEIVPKAPGWWPQRLFSAKSKV